MSIVSFMIHQLIRKVHTTFRVDGLYHQNITLGLYVHHPIQRPAPFCAMIPLSSPLRLFRNTLGLGAFGGRATPYPQR